MAPPPGLLPVVYSPGYQADLHGHVFPIEKYPRVLERLLASGTIAREQVVEPPPATRLELGLVHTPEYLDDLFALRVTSRTASSEMALDEAIVRAFAHGTGGTIRAVALALERGAAVNLGGGLHHAFADRAEGFCYLNDVAVALRVAQRAGMPGRALVADTDVHQGNGTARIFQGDDSVVTFSIHQENNYPVKERSDLDSGLPDFAGDDLYLGALDRALAALAARGPFQLVVHVAGADPFAGDRLGGLSLTFAGLRERDRRVARFAREQGAALAVTLAGGYAHDVEDTVAIHVATVEETAAAGLSRG